MGTVKPTFQIENVWKLLKYVFFKRKVNLCPRHLLDKLLGIPGNEASLAASVVDYYRRKLRGYIL